MKEIYLVIGVVEYEGITPVKAFDLLEGAYDFSTRCNNYEDAPIKNPPDRADDHAWDNYISAIEGWKKSHPAGAEDAHYDCFEIVRVPYCKKPTLEQTS